MTGSGLVRQSQAGGLPDLVGYPYHTNTDGANALLEIDLAEETWAHSLGGLPTCLRKIGDDDIKKTACSSFKHLL